MALEDLTGTKYLDDLVATNPAAGDDVSEGDDHIRGIKNVLKTTFPSIDGAITATDTELNYVDGVTSAIQTQLDAPVAKGDGSSADGQITLNCSQNTHGIKLKSPPHSANATYTLTFPNNDGDSGQKLTTNGSGVLTWTADNATDSTKMPLAGGAFSGAVTTNSTIDGRDVAADGVTADAALPKAGGTVTGNVIHNDNVKALFGTGSDLEIYHSGSASYIKDVGTGSLQLLGSGNVNILNGADTEYCAKFITDGAVELYHNNAKKIETTANGVTVTGGAVGTMTTDNDGSFAMSASNNFKCTPAGNFALTFTSIVAQSGNILFINSGGHTISAHANTKVDATLLATISTAGTYLLSYFSDGTNVYMTNSAAYA